MITKLNVRCRTTEQLSILVGRAIGDYLQIFYDCTPHDVTGPVGFTVKIEDSYDAVQYNVIDFSRILANFGGNFNHATHSFICPDCGVYKFALTVCTHADYTRVQLRKRNEILTTVYVGNDNDDIDCSSPTFITECNVGDVIWVMSAINGHIHSGFDQALISGVLLYRY